MITAKSKNQRQTDSNDKEKADEIAMKFKDNKGKEPKLTEEQALLYANDKGKKAHIRKEKGMCLTLGCMRVRQKRDKNTPEAENNLN